MTRTGLRGRGSPPRPFGAGVARALGVTTAVALAACGGDDGPRPTSPASLANATYLTDATETGWITLEDGAATPPPGTGVRRITLAGSGAGDLDGDGEDDAAAVLVEERGMDRILRLHALLADEDSVGDVAARMIGDRFRVESVAVADGLIDLRLLTRPPGAPSAAPATVPTRLRFALTDRGLMPVNPPQPREARVGEPRTPPTLASNQWNLVRIESGEWSADADEFPQAPYLRFAEELPGTEVTTGQVSGQAGCNRLFSTYEAGATGTLRIHAIAVTRRMCDPGVMDRERRLVAALGAASRHTLSGDSLEIEFAGGSLTFVAGPELAPPEPAQDLDARVSPDPGVSPDTGHDTTRTAARRQT